VAFRCRTPPALKRGGLADSSQTALWAGHEQATFAAVTPGAQLLKLEVTVEYTLFCALEVVVLLKGAELPK